MPILIKKGSDRTKKKKGKHGKQVSKNDSRESLPDHSNISHDMTDVLDFKIYRIIKPNFYNKTTKVNLLGEEYYRDEDGQPIERALDSDEDDKKECDPALPKQKGLPSIPLSTVTKDLGFASILTRIKESDRETQVIKNGHHIGKFFTPPTIEETLDWSLKFVTANSDSLVLYVIDLYCQLKNIEGNLEWLAKNYRSDRPRGQSEDAAARDRTYSSYSTYSTHSEEPHPGGRNRTESSDTGHDRAIVSESPPRQRVGSDNSNNKNNNIRRASSRLLSGTGATDPLMSAASDRMNASYQANSRSKHLSLAQQLEQIKSHGTDAFIRSISPRRESIFPQGKRNWKMHTGSKASFDTNNNNNNNSNNNSSSNNTNTNTSQLSKGWEGMRKSSIVAITLSKMNSNNPHADSSASLRPAPPPGPRPSSTSNSTTASAAIAAAAAAGSGNISGCESGVGTGESVSRDSPRKHGGRVERPSAASSVGASRAIEEAQAGMSLRPPEPTISRKSPRSGRNIQKSAQAKPRDPGSAMVEHSQRMLAALLKKTTAIQTVIAGKLSRAQRAGSRVVKLNHEFDSKVSNADMKAGCLFEEKEFSRPVSLMHQLQCYEQQVRDGHESKSLHKDMRRMRDLAAKKTAILYSERLLRHRWFLALLVKLRQFMKKMNNAVPLCCLQFVIAIQQILVLDYMISQEMFYRILEATVVNPEDHLKAIVHQILKVVREVVDISAYDFLTYLESKDISPNPELTNQVRAETKSKKMNSASALLTTSTAMRTLSIGSSTGGEGGGAAVKGKKDDEAAIIRKNAMKVDFAPETSESEAYMQEYRPSQYRSMHSPESALSALVTAAVDSTARGSILAINNPECD